jgi:Leucine-rich repeat (LRR) protein
LEYFSCGNNQLTNLDVGNNTGLIKLDCSDNQITNLDVSKNTALLGLYCSSNKLTNLDVSKNTALKTLTCISNLNLTTICMNVFHNTFTWQKDATASYSTNCITGVESGVEEEATVLKAYNLQGIEVPLDTQDQVIILLYSNGKREKVLQ